MVRYAMLVATALMAAPLLAQEPAKSGARHLVDRMLAAHPSIAKRAKNARDQLSRKIPNRAQPWQVDPAIPTRTCAQHLVNQVVATHPRIWLSATS